MKLQAQLNQDRYHWLLDDEHHTLGEHAYALVEVEAPAVAATHDASPTNLVAVLDHSGSMGGGRLKEAQKALCDIVDRLSGNDNFGLVTFDNDVEVVVPAGPVKDRGAIKRMINGVHTGGSTDLAAGLVRGLKEARRLEALEGVRVLLISDGHANHGVTDPDVLGSFTGKYLDHRVTTSTLGMGLGFDERLLSAIARHGSGNEHFAENADTASGLIAQECGELLSQAFLSCRLKVRLANGTRNITLLNEFTHRWIGDEFQIDLGGLQAEELRTLVLQFQPAPSSRVGQRKLATLEFEYVQARDLSEHVVKHNVWAVVDSAASQTDIQINWDVAAEATFQRAQNGKRQAVESLAIGDIEAATQHIESAIELLTSIAPHLAPATQAEFAEEIANLKQMKQEARVDRIRIGKCMSMSASGSSRARGRTRA